LVFNHKNVRISNSKLKEYEEKLSNTKGLSQYSFSLVFKDRRQ